MRPVIKVSLTKAEKGRLQKLLANEKNPKQARRFQAILLADELPREKVGELLGITVRMIEILVRSYKKEGVKGLIIKNPPGRPSTIPAKKREEIISIIEENPHGWSTKQIRELIYKKGSVLFCKRHVYRIAQKWGFAQVTPRPRNVRRSDTAVYQFKKRQKE